MALGSGTIRRSSGFSDAYEALAAELLLLEVRRAGRDAVQGIAASPTLTGAWRYFFRDLTPEIVLTRLWNGTSNSWQLVGELRRALRIAREI